MLYVVATPIGNLEDITLRALRVLREVALIACEDTRHTRKLLSHYKIATPMVSYHEYNERERSAELIARMREGASVALVSDAGTPLISDPGFRLVREATRQGIEVVSVPGASALTTALAASGLPTEAFFFAGFLPPKTAARRQRLQELSRLAATLVLYEAPHRVQQTLTEALDILGNRSCVLARELTKLHEEFLRGPLAEVVAALEAKEIRGEIVLLFGPPLPVAETRSQSANDRSLRAAIEELMRTENLDEKSALKRLARERGLARSEAYRLLVAEKAANKKSLESRATADSPDSLDSPDSPDFIEPG